MGKTVYLLMYVRYINICYWQSSSSFHLLEQQYSVINTWPELTRKRRDTHGDSDFIVVEDQSGVNTGEFGYGSHRRCWILQFWRWMPKFNSASRRIEGLSFGWRTKHLRHVNLLQRKGKLEGGILAYISCVRALLRHQRKQRDDKRHPHSLLSQSGELPLLFISFEHSSAN